MATTHITWMDDLKAESDLRAMSVAFETKTITAKQIDVPQSSRNGARLGDPIVPHLVADYRLAMQNGDSFPRPVVYGTPTGYVILSGNQRCAAIRELIEEGKLDKDQPIQVYLVLTSDKMLLEAIARAGNVGHGGRATQEDRLQHALYMVRTWGMRAKEAAKFWMVGETTIAVHIRAEKEREQLLAAGVNANPIPVNTLDALSRLGFSEGSKVNLAHLVTQHSPSTERVKQVVSAMVKTKSESQRLQHIKQFEQELAEAAHRQLPATTNGRPHKVPSRPRRDRIINEMTRLANFLDHGLDGQAFLTPDELQISSQTDMDTLCKAWKRVESRMKKIVKHPSYLR
jgi:hypothetical protein